MERSGEAPNGGADALPSPGRLWTLEEATIHLPMLRDTLRELQGWVIRLRTIHAERERLAAFWGAELQARDHPDRALRDRLESETTELTRKLEGEIARLQSEGIEVKDLDSGLLDLYSLLDGELVFLCWKDGEDAIGYFHSLTGGFRNRRALPRQSASAAEPRHQSA
ncbi:MAG: DUF2203 domain-containing protein [Thermoplasmata archaeon]|nr:DUF2203 domain-containing protein [Thermoplasmata archaeon]